MPYPSVRRAEPHHYKAIWEIWTQQDHVSQWMSFIKQDEADFKATYDRLAKSSDIYVVVDLFDDVEEVIGVQRIHYGKGPNQHVAEYCSLGTHKDYQGKGYATLLHNEFEKTVKAKGIKKIELTQDGGNKGAFKVVDNQHFGEEGLFPDWLPRAENGGASHLIELYRYKFIDDELAKIAKSLPSLKYKEVYPDPNTDACVNIERNGNVFTCSHDSKTLFILNLDPNETTYSHIGFLSFDLTPTEYSPETVAGLKMILQAIMLKARVKKVELFTHDSTLIKICQHAGFFVRGEKLASRFENGSYQNELGLEYSFFNIEDAKKLIFAKINNPTRKKTIEKALSVCQTTIENLRSKAPSDDLGANYLENLIYQMVRDEMGEKRVFSLDENNWEPLLSQVPRDLYVDINDLHKKLLTICYGFFAAPTFQIEQHSQRSINIIQMT